MPEFRYGMSSGYFNGKIYLVGGNSGTIETQTWEYDPVANSWNTTRLALPQARYNAVERRDRRSSLYRGRPRHG